MSSKKMTVGFGMENTLTHSQRLAKVQVRVAYIVTLQNIERPGLVMDRLTLVHRVRIDLKGPSCVVPRG